MRIAYISYEYPPDTAFGGIATYVKQAASLMSMRGHYVEVFAASLQRSGHFDEEGIGVNLIAEKNRDRFRDAIVPIFSQRNIVSPFDVVESPEYCADGLEVQAMHPRLPHIVKMHTPSQLVRELNFSPPQITGWVRHNLSQGRMFLGAIRRRQKPVRYRSFRPGSPAVSDAEQMEKKSAQQSVLVVCPSEALRNWVVRQWSIDIAKTKVIPNPYSPSDKLLSIQPVASRSVVGYLGRLEQRKGIETLTEAIPLILAAEPESRFRIVGDAVRHPGTLEWYDRYMLRRLRDYRRSIKMIGARPAREMENEYSKIDICVLPSVWENFPNVCLEAMAAGRAIVASNSGGMAEILEGGKHGLLIPPRNPAAIAEAVLRVLRSPQLRQDLGSSARHRVIAAYGPNKIGPELERCFQTAIDLHSIRCCN